MNMVDRRKFRRKNRPGLDAEQADSTPAAKPQRQAPESAASDHAARAEARAREVRAREAHERAKDEAARLKAEAARQAEETRKAENLRLLEEERRAEAARLAENERRKEEARQSAARKRAEEERAHQKAEEARIVRMQRENEQRRAADEREAEERARLAAIRQREEDARRAEEARKAEHERQEREHQRTEEERVRRAEEERQAREKARERQERLDREAEQRRIWAEAARKEEAERNERQVARTRAAQQAALPETLWQGLPEFSVDVRHLDRNHIVTASRHDPAHAAFDVLRTRLLQALSEHGWKRVAITSPSKDCGKTFTAANLAISLSRQANCRTLLIDCDLRRPTLHKVMGVRDPGAMGDVLRGEVSARDHFMRLGPNAINAGRNIAFGFNDQPEPYAAELLQDPNTGRVLDEIEKSFAPDVMLFDLPPALYFDDVIAFRPQFDGVLLVVGGGVTTEKEVREVERRLGESTPLLGTVLNKAEGTKLHKYNY